MFRGNGICFNLPRFRLTVAFLNKIFFCDQQMAIDNTDTLFDNSYDGSICNEIGLAKRL